jgi:hypothetical protein
VTNCRTARSIRAARYRPTLTSGLPQVW